MGKSYRPYLPEQDFLLPPSLRDWLPENHLAYFASGLVDQFDLPAIVRSHATPVHPRVARVHERSEGTRGSWLHRATPPAPPRTQAPHRSAPSGTNTPVARRQAPSGGFDLV